MKLYSIPSSESFFTMLSFLFIVLIVIGLPFFIWFGCRIEVGPNELAVLIKKTGKDLPSGEILALNPDEKGIQLNVLPEGRYFKNPYTWDWEIHKVIDIPAGKLGVLTRLYGKDLPSGEILAKDGTKGIIREVLMPGKYRINPYAYYVQIFDAIHIKPGCIGIVVNLEGKDILNSDLKPEEKNTFLVSTGMKGVIPETLEPGTYYLNPYVVNVVEVNLQSQRFEISGEDAITFPTADGFFVTVEGTIEFAVNRQKAALLTHRVGDLDEIVNKVILPRVRGFSRIEGSKHPAINFIVGQTRQKFQEELESHLRNKCSDWGVDIKSVLIRKVVVPDEIASIIREREIAVQEGKKYEQEIEQARSKAELVKQEMLAVQNREKVNAETKKMAAIITARQEQQVKILEAERELEVAKVNLEAAKFTAQSIELKAEGERDVIRAKNEAEASVIRARVNALGSGINLAKYTFYETIAPHIKTILTADREGLGEIFGSFLIDRKEVSK